MNANYQEIPGLLQARQPFSGNSMSAMVGEPAHRYGDNIVYTVWSYSTVIAEVYEDGQVIHNEDKYSKTTTRHQKLCKGNL